MRVGQGFEITPSGGEVSQGDISNNSHIYLRHILAVQESYYCQYWQKMDTTSNLRYRREGCDECAGIYREIEEYKHVDLATEKY